MKRLWFKRWGWICFPVSIPGVVLALLAVAFCVQVFIAIDRHSHSASDTLYGVFPYVASVFLLLNWVGSQTCRNETSSE